MTDYGHDLMFGTFVTPTADNPGHVLELAQLADRSGLDIVTFQDHPYQPRFLDTQTLMSVVGARTQNISVAANVTNLPLRPPLLLAKATATLDLLTEGRVVLGLGAGAFWDAIVAMGAQRLTPGQSLTAVGEAIDLIRQSWDTDTKGGIFFEGKQYQVSGARRGPAPTHPVPIWVGGYGPRMLDLIGRTADGWVPSISYLPKGVDSLPELNARIDDAAAAAGREPTAIRRILGLMGGEFAPTAGADLLHGPVALWIDQLTDLAVEHGIGAFLLGTDDPDVTARYANEVVPAVRERVASSRA